MNKTKNTKIKIFVYGTLKRNKGLNKYYMKSSKFIKEDSVKGELYSLGAYPALFHGDRNVPGEIFEMPINDYDILFQMEESAGYSTENIKTKSGIDVMIFFFRFENAKVKENRIDEW